MKRQMWINLIYFLVILGLLVGELGEHHTLAAQRSSSCDEAIAWLDEARWTHTADNPWFHNRKPTETDRRWVKRYSSIIHLLERLCTPIGE